MSLARGLDDEQKNGFVQLVNDLCEEFGKTLIYISHYEEEIPACIGKVFELQNGMQQVYVTRAVMPDSNTQNKLYNY